MCILVKFYKTISYEFLFCTLPTILAVKQYKNITNSSTIYTTHTNTNTCIWIWTIYTLFFFIYRLCDCVCVSVCLCPHPLFFAFYKTSFAVNAKMPVKCLPFKEQTKNNKKITSTAGAILGQLKPLINRIDHKLYRIKNAMTISQVIVKSVRWTQKWKHIIIYTRACTHALYAHIQPFI